MCRQSCQVRLLKIYPTLSLCKVPGNNGLHRKKEKKIRDTGLRANLFFPSLFNLSPGLNFKGHVIIEYV